MSDENSQQQNNDTTPEGNQPPQQTINSELAEQQALAEKFKNDYLYLRAEFDNYKRNVIKERSELVKYGNERLLVDILNVVDNFERALETKLSADNLATYSKGIEMTYQELKSVLSRFGLSEVAAHGQPFDPNIHEALSSEETEAVKPGHIHRVFKKPYKLHDKVIRPGQVVVAKEKTSN